MHDVDGARLGSLADDGAAGHLEIVTPRGAEEPVSFFAYRGMQSRLVPEGCEVFRLAHRHEDVVGALEALADRVRAPATPTTVEGARPAVICAVTRVVDDRAERHALADRTGATACDMESAALAATGRLHGVLRAIADGPERPLGALGNAAKPDGSVAWRPVVRAFLAHPVSSARAARAASRGFASLSRALAGNARG